MPTDADDWPRLILYRIAYGLAHDLREAGGFDMDSSRWAGSAAARGDLDAIGAEVRRRLDVAGDPEAEATVREGVADAM